MALPIVLQQAVVDQITQQYRSLITSMHTWIRANPTATAAQATTALNALADPYPSDTVKITDRAAAFNWLAGKVHPYEGKSTAYLSLRQLMIDHPVAFLFSLDYDSGRSVTTRAEALYRRVAGDIVPWGNDVVSGITKSETRDAAKGNYTNSETISGTVGGVTYTLRRTITLTANANGGYDSSPNEWTVV